MPPGQPPSIWLRLPRLVYWVVGAAVSFGAAAGARLLAETVPPPDRVPIWLVGAVFIFVGLAILSLGTKGRREVEELFAENNGDQVNGADNGRAPAVTAEEAALMARLGALGIQTRTVRHPPMFTVAESKALRGSLPGGHSKNLFLKDKKGVLWLIVAHEDRVIDLKALRSRIGSAALSFASAERLRQALGVEPGSVTPFALINDPEARVKVVLDADLLALSPLNFHPLVNTATTAIAADDLLVFVRSCGHEPKVVTLSSDPGGELEETGARRHV